jgi:DNA-binding response OmpR family regulator
MAGFKKVVMENLEEAVADSSAGKIQVIIVEPEPAVAFTVKDILDASGFAAKAFTDPVQGLQAVLSENPRVVIAAVLMPQINGIELAIQAKAKCPDCKILLWSALPEAAALNDEARARGYSFEILPKPLHPTELLHKIHEEIYSVR